MKNKKLTILMAEFMGYEFLRSDVAGLYYRTKDSNGDYTCFYCDPFENPAQMNDFIEHPDVMMEIAPFMKNWLARVDKSFNENVARSVENKSRAIAINHCAAAFFGETYEE